MQVRDVLVPVDFSANSLRALDFAESLIESDGEIYLLHVIDMDFVNRMNHEGFGEPDSLIERMRGSAETRLQEVIRDRPPGTGRVEYMIVVGKPFAEILRVASDLDFEMMVLGMHGLRGDDIEELLFGSTAEKVLRGTQIPVLCVPSAARR